MGKKVSKKVKRLPFVVSPRLEPILEVLGSEESGQIEIERKGYLTVAEKAYSSAALAGDESIGSVRRLAFKISRATGIEVQKVLSDIGAGGLEEYFEPYREELDMCLGFMAQYQERRAIIAATTLLVYRIDRDWDIEDTLALHPDIRDALHLLFEEEEQKNTEALEELRADNAEEGKE